MTRNPRNPRNRPPNSPSNPHSNPDSPNSPHLQQLLNNLPVIGQQQRAAAASINQAVQGMAMAIFTQAAARLIAVEATNTNPINYTTDALLQLLAQDSMRAAKAYFAGLGIATFRDEPQTPQPPQPQPQDPQP